MCFTAFRVRTGLELGVEEVHLVQEENECRFGEKLALAYGLPQIERIQLIHDRVRRAIVRAKAKVLTRLFMLGSSGRHTSKLDIGHRKIMAFTIQTLVHVNWKWMGSYHRQRKVPTQL